MPSFSVERRKMKEKKTWLWEFSKRIVVSCSILYFIGNIVAMVIMAMYQDLSSLGTLLDNLTTVMTTCVFGYFVKAGVENAIKIKINNQE